MSLETPNIEQVRARGLIAGLDSFQQSYLNKLIAEYEEHFGQIKLDELEVQINRGDRKARQIYMAIVDKLKEIVDFLENKETELVTVKGKLFGNHESVVCIDPRLKDYFGLVSVLSEPPLDGKVYLPIGRQPLELPEESVAKFYTNDDYAFGRAQKIVIGNHKAEGVLNLQQYLGVNVGDKFQLTEYGKKNPDCVLFQGANELSVVGFIFDNVLFWRRGIFVALEFMVEDKNGPEPKMVKEVFVSDALEVWKNFKKIN